MRLHHLSVKNFRGIASLDWTISTRFSCLVGPGDSTKSTVLDAIECVLSPRWNLPFDDTDFYNCDSTKSIEVTAALGELPETLLTEKKFGLDLRGWDFEKKLLRDEPTDDYPVLSIKLQVDSDLEPRWTVFNDRMETEKRISHQDRELLHLARLGMSVDWHLSWRRGSVLSRITGPAADNPDNLAGILAEATRAARDNFDPSHTSVLTEAAVKTQGLAREIGVLSASPYQPHLDFQAMAVGVGGITLHEGSIPLRRAGLGTRRLLSLALQKEAAKSGGITLVDEVEHGLEPHRIRKLLLVLSEHTFIQNSVPQEGDEAPEIKPLSQVVVTTHAPSVIEAVHSESLCVVRSIGGKTTVKSVGSAFQNVVRATPDALLARRIVVCEGKTEVGFCSALDAYWTAAKNDSFALLGVVPVTSSSGSGSAAPAMAKALAELGYQTSLLIDSDEAIDPTVEVLQAAAVVVFQWDGGVSIEERIFLDLPWSGVLELLALRCEEVAPESIRDAVVSRIAQGVVELGTDFKTWTDDSRVRAAIGKAAKAKRAPWFKRQDLGERLGQVVTPHLEAISTSLLATKVSSLRAWVDAK